MRVHHLALRTRDVARLARFYEEVLGLRREPRPGGGESVWLAADATIVMIERAADGEPAVPAGSMELAAFAIDPRDAARFRESLAARGVPVEAETAYTLYFRDPDGRRVAVSHYPFTR